MAKRRKKTAFIILILLALLALILRIWLFSRDEYEPIRKSIPIARDATWAPFDFMAKEGNVTAFSDELLDAIAKTEKISIHLYGASSSVLLAGLHNGSYLGVLSPVIPSGPLADHYLASEPYFRFGPVLVVRKGATITHLSQLKDSAVGTLRGTFLRLTQDTYQDLSLVPYDNVLIALQHLAEGVLDGVIIGAFPAYVYTRGLFSDKLKVATGPLTTEGLRLLVLNNPQGQQLLNTFSQGLETVKANGTYDALIKKWNLFNADATEPSAESSTR